MDREPRVWVVRAQDGRWAGDFWSNGYIDVHHGMDGVDLSTVTSRDEFRRLFMQQHPWETNKGSIGNRAGQVARFHLEVRAGDYVLMPGPLRDREVFYGRFSTDDRYYVSGADGLPCRNRKRVDWARKRLSRDELPDGMLQGGTTLYEVTDAYRKYFFLSLVGEFSEPDVGIMSKEPDTDAIDYDHPPYAIKYDHPPYAIEYAQPTYAIDYPQPTYPQPIYAIDDAHKDELIIEPDDLQQIPDCFQEEKNLIRQDSPGGEPRVWVIRAQVARWADEFWSNGYIDVHQGMDGVDLSTVTSSDEFVQLFVQEHPGETNELSISNRAGLVARFHLEVGSGDYVLMPGLNRDVFYGRFSTDDRYYVSAPDGLPCRNRRRVDWAPERVSRDELPDGILQGGTTLYEVTDPYVKDGFLSFVNEFSGSDVEIMSEELDEDAIEYDQPTYAIDDAHKDELFIEQDDLRQIPDRFQDEKNQIRQDSSGVEKTWVSKLLFYVRSWFRRR